MSHRIGVAAGMNSIFLFSFIFYVIVVCVGVYFASVYDYNPYDQMTHTVIGGLVGSASTLLGLMVFLQLDKNSKKEFIK